MTLIMALLEMTGVAIIMPFMSILLDPNLIETNPYLIILYDYLSFFGIETKEQFLFVFGAIVFFILILSIFFKALTTYFHIRFVHFSEYQIGKNLLQSYIKQPYSWFLNRHSSEFSKTILSEVYTIIFSGLVPLMNLVAQSCVSVAIIILLILVDPKLTFAISLVLISWYFIIYKFTRAYLNKIGQERLEYNQARFKTLSDSFGAVKEIKIGNLEKIYINMFSFFAKIYASRQSSADVIRQLPRYLLESFLFGGIIIVVLYLIYQYGNIVDVLPLISLFAFAAYRIMPALQQIYGSVTQLSFVGPAIDTLYSDYKSLKISNLNYKKNLINFNNSIKLENIDYCYPNSSKLVLKNINLEIPYGSKVGIMGTTGSGKTTTIDIIVGLLSPIKGALKVDDQIINSKNLSAWYSIIGYVPQNIHLVDDTIEANIAFGVEKKNINKDRLIKASMTANLHNFIESDLPKKYQTIIGERGVRLSGGQRQRIGIARALYNNPRILILDEATSSLDHLTETEIINKIYNMPEKITIIAVAHRLSTLKSCDFIFQFEKGEISNQGNYDKIILNNN
jgi:ABC-type bacteriocin/lantibiotic exporter with double-glycine peptidase domain